MIINTAIIDEWTSTPDQLEAGEKQLEKLMQSGDYSAWQLEIVLLMITELQMVQNDWSLDLDRN